MATASAAALCGGISNAPGERLVTTDPNLSLQLPPGWRSIAVTDTRKLVVQMMAVMTDPALKRAFEWQLAELDSGVVRLAGRGISTPSCASASILLEIRPRAASVDDAVEAWQAHLAEAGLPPVTEASEPVDLSIGHAVRRTLTTNPPGGIPSRSIEYVVLLGDGRVAILIGVAPAIDAGFPALVDATAQSMTAG
jgi:hypothetical protein